MISALLAAMVGVLVVVACLLVVVLALLCRLLALWGAVGRSETRSHARRATTAARPFSGGSGAVERSVHSTTRVVGR
uniref:hypothetical protein n=1 Tax=Parolsenella massiliensis TaxID=1871022 RepID=UPI00093345BB|nr:hypothetical protein [Parolsenella massiliensis]